jgi:hypothetical protein
VQGLSAVTYGGTLSVSNLAGTPVAGQRFTNFDAAGASGNFAAITPQLAGGLRWQFDPASGVLSVVSSASQPRIAEVSVAGTSLIFLGTNGPPGATGYLLASTNLTLSKTSWTRVATNVSDVSGVISFTNAIAGTSPRFFLISVVAGP